MIVISKKTKLLEENSRNQTMIVLTEYRAMNFPQSLVTVSKLVAEDKLLPTWI